VSSPEPFSPGSTPSFDETAPLNPEGASGLQDDPLGYDDSSETDPGDAELDELDDDTDPDDTDLDDTDPDDTDLDELDR